MMYSARIINFIELLSKYNWSWNKEFKNEDLLVFNKYYAEYDTKYSIVFPSDESFEDFDYKLDRAITSLSSLENVSEIEIKEFICIKNRDLIKFRLSSSISEDGTLPLNIATKFLQSIYDLLVSSIEQEKVIVPYIKRITNDSRVSASTYRFTQTQRGSFVMNVCSDDLSSYVKQISIDQSIAKPIVRRATERIIHGLNKVVTVENFETLVEESYLTGLNANMCDALVTVMAENKDIELETKVLWSKEFDTIDCPSSVKINDSVMTTLIKLSERYKEMVNIEAFDVVARITTLNYRWHDNKEDETLDHVITISWYDNIYKKQFNCKAQLSEESYRIACDAHRDSNKVRISGLVDKNRKRWFMFDIKNFEVVD